MKRLRLAALASATDGRRRPGGEDTDGVHVTSKHLLGLDRAAKDLAFLPRQPARSLLSGRHGSRLRGRGVMFEEMRQYLTGDDVRAIDWHVTARMGRPYVRTYVEDRDRPALILVDQRINMFFGSVRSMKSVAAAEAAALCAWSALAQGDRVGGLVFDDGGVHENRPQRSRAAVLRFLDAVAARNGALAADGAAVRAPGQLDAALDRAAALAPHDQLVIIASDFDGDGDRTRSLLRRLAKANHVVALLVYDPFLLALPQSGEMVASDGALQVELGFGKAAVRQRLAAFADGRTRDILEWQRSLGVTVLPVSAAKEVAPQLRHLLGQAAWRDRRR